MQHKTELHKRRIGKSVRKAYKRKKKIKEDAEKEKQMNLDRMKRNGWID